LASRLKLYPDVPAKHRSTILRDLVLLGLVVVFAWMGFKVHDAVNSLAVLGSGVKHAGLSVQSGFSSAAGAVGGIPLIGGKLSDALQSAGQGSGGNVAAFGQSGNPAHRGRTRTSNRSAAVSATSSSAWSCSPA
jgi:hypothetical protein